MLHTTAKGLLGCQLLAADPQVVHQEMPLLLGLPADLLGLAIEINENVDLRFEDQGLNRLENVIDRACRVPLEDVHVVLIEGRQKEDRHTGRTRSASDQARHLVAVETRHLHIKKNDCEVTLENIAQS